MINNSNITIYHKTLNTTTRLEEWTRYNYSNVWFFGSKGAIVNTGYESNDGVEIRIPLTESIILDNFAIGDIIVKGTLTTNIEKQEDLNCQLYNIVNIKVNDFGSRPHIHLRGQ